jgi:hypothetical protein
MATSAQPRPLAVCDAGPVISSIWMRWAAWHTKPLQLLECFGPVAPAQTKHSIGHGQKCQRYRKTSKQDKKKSQGPGNLENREADLSAAIGIHPGLSLQIFFLIVPTSRNAAVRTVIAFRPGRAAAFRALRGSHKLLAWRLKGTAAASAGGSLFPAIQMEAGPAWGAPSACCLKKNLVVANGTWFSG